MAATTRSSTQQNGPPFFSIVTPTFNRWPLLSEALASVERQVFQDFEILIVDDGSTDGTREKLRRSDFPVEVLECDRCGPAGARNRGIMRARGRFLAFLDSDDLWLPQHLSEAHELLARHPDLRFLFSDTRFRLRTGVRESYLAQKTIENVPFAADGTWRVFQRSIYPELVDEPTVATSSVIAETSLVQALGGFCENLRPFGEDTDLWLRLAARAQAAANWEVTVERRKHGDNLVESGEDVLRLSKEIELLQSHYAADGREFRERIRSRLARVRFERAKARARTGDVSGALGDSAAGFLSSPRRFTRELGHFVRRRLDSARKN